MEKSVTKGIAGVSLVEIMISLVLVAIALIAVSSTFPSMNRNRKGIQESDQAKILAVEVLDGLQNLGCCEPVAAAGDTCVAFSNKYKNQQISMGVVQYKPYWTCPTNNVANEVFKAVDVNVEWYKGSKKHTVKVTGVVP